MENNGYVPISERAKIRQNSDYLYGSAAPARVPERRTVRPKKEVDTSILYDFEEKQEEVEVKAPARKINIAFLAVLAIFLVGALGISISYLSLQAENTRVRENITLLESQLDTITAQNDSLDYTINSYIDVSNITKVATKKLGMVRITKDQISMYESSEQEYMQTYE